MTEFWWKSKFNLYSAFGIEWLKPYIVPAILISAVVFLIYLKKWHKITIKKLVKIISILWFSYTVIFSIIVLIILLSSKVKVTSYVLVINMFTISATLTLLTFSNIVGFVYSLFCIIPKFLYSSGITNTFTIEVGSILIDVIIFILGSILFIYNT